MKFFDNEAEWLDWRRDGIGGSDIANILHGTYGGATAVAANKLDYTPPEEDTDGRMARGHAWETRLADLIHATHGLYIFAEQACIQHPGHPHHRASLDGLFHPHPELDGPGIVAEFKTLGIGAPMNWASWTTQAQWGMWCRGANQALIVAGFVDDDTDTLTGHRSRLVDADPTYQQALAELADQTWSHVQAKTIPDPEWASALPVVKHLTRLANPDDTEPIDLDDIAHHVTRYAAIRDALAAARDEKDQLEASIKHRIGAATKATTATHAVTYSKNQRVFTATSAEAFALAYPHLGLQPDDDRNVYKTIDKKLYAELGEPIGPRTLTIKEHKQ